MNPVLNSASLSTGNTSAGTCQFWSGVSLLSRRLYQNTCTRIRQRGHRCLSSRHSSPWSETLSHKVAENWAAQPSGPGCLLSQWPRFWHTFTVGPVACLISWPDCTPLQWARLHALSVGPVAHLHSGPGCMPYQWARLHTFTVGPVACLISGPGCTPSQWAQPRVVAGRNGPVDTWNCIYLSKITYAVTLKFQLFLKF